MKKILSFVLLLATACSQPQKARQVSAYFDLKSFLDAEIAHLSAQKPVLSKTVSVEERPETVQSRTVDWAKELELFQQADLNKLANVGSYIEEDVSETTKTYRLKSGENLPVQFLEIIKDPTSGALLKMKATLRTQNYLFESERTLSLSTVNNHLSSYEIEGFQQLFYGDPDPFRVEGRILELVKK